MGPHGPWFRRTLRIPILPRDLARAVNHWRSGRSSYPLPRDRDQSAASRTLGPNSRHHYCASRAYSPIYRNFIRHLYAVGTLAVCFRTGVRADSCGMTGEPVDHSHSTYAWLKPVQRAIRPVTDNRPAEAYSPDQMRLDRKALGNLARGLFCARHEARIDR